MALRILQRTDDLVKLEDGTTVRVYKAVEDGKLTPHTGCLPGETKVRFALRGLSGNCVLVSRKVYNWAVEYLRPPTPEEEVGGGRMGHIHRANIAMLQHLPQAERDKVDIVADGLKTKREATDLALRNGGIVALGSKRGRWGVIKAKAKE
jgi:hypothetical protein